MLAGLPAEVALAGCAFTGTNLDNALVAASMVAAAPHERAGRIAGGQVAGFVVLVVAGPVLLCLIGVLVLVRAGTFSAWV